MDSLFAKKHFGILPLISGTLLTTFIAVCVALPLGLVIAICSQYAPKGFRKIIKPLTSTSSCSNSSLWFFCTNGCYSISAKLNTKHGRV